MRIKVLKPRDWQVAGRTTMLTSTGVSHCAPTAPSQHVMRLLLLTLLRGESDEAGMRARRVPGCRTGRTLSGPVADVATLGALGARLQLLDVGERPALRVEAAR